MKSFKRFEFKYKLLFSYFSFQLFFIQCAPLNVLMVNVIIWCEEIEPIYQSQITLFYVMFVSGSFAYCYRMANVKLCYGTK